jgi:biopolymer transport protein ExbD
MKKTYSMSIYQKYYLKDAPSKHLEEMNITSLLDILVTILIYLILSYNPKDFEIILSQKNTPPLSMSREISENLLTVQVNKDFEVYVGSKIIGHLEDKDLNANLSSSLKNLAFKNKEAANLIIDESVTYEHMQKLMKILSLEKINKYKLVVLGGIN